MAQPFEKLIADGVQLEVIQLAPKLQPLVRVVPHSRRGGDEFFLDLYTIAIDSEDKEAETIPGGKAILYLPGRMEAMTLRWYDENKNTFVNLPYSKKENGGVHVQIPSFKHYGSIHASGLK